MKKVFLKPKALLKNILISFFDVYLLAYIALVHLSIKYGNKYKLAILLCTFAYVIGCTSKFLQKKKARESVSKKSILVFLILALAYYAPAYIKNLSAISVTINIVAVFAMFGFFKAAINVSSLLYEYITSNSKKKKVKIIRESDLLKNVQINEISVNSVYDSFSTENFKEDSVAQMIYEFSSFSFNNELGHFMIKGMSKEDENGLSKYIIKTKNGYQVIIRGSFDEVKPYCKEAVQKDGLISFDDVTEILEKKIKEEKNKVYCCAYYECKNIQEADSLSKNFIFAGYIVKEIVLNYESECELAVVECKNKDYTLSLCKELDVKCYDLSMLDVVKRLEKEDADIINPYKDKGIDIKDKLSYIKPCENYQQIIGSIFDFSAAVMLLAMVLCATISKVIIFSGLEVLMIGALCFMTSVVTVVLADDKGISKNKKGVLWLVFSLVLCTIFLTGRFFMANAEYEGDLFYYTTSRTMTFVGMWLVTLLYPFLISKSINDKNRKIRIVILTVAVLPWVINSFATFFEIHKLNFIYTITSMMIVIVVYIVLKFLYSFKKKRSKNGK